MIVKLKNSPEPMGVLSSDKTLYGVYVIRNGNRVYFNVSGTEVDVVLMEWEDENDIKYEINENSSVSATTTTILVTAQDSSSLEYSMTITEGTWTETGPVVKAVIKSSVEGKLSKLVKTTVNNRDYQLGTLRFPDLTGVTSSNVVLGVGVVEWVSSELDLVGPEADIWTGEPILKVTYSGVSVYWKVIVDPDAFEETVISTVSGWYPDNKPAGLYGYFFFGQVFIPLELITVSEAYEIYAGVLGDATAIVGHYIISDSDIDFAFHEDDLDFLISWNENSDGGFSDEQISFLGKTLSERILLRVTGNTAEDEKVKQYLETIISALPAEVLTLRTEYFKQLKKDVEIITGSVSWWMKLSSQDWKWIERRASYAKTRNLTVGDTLKVYEVALSMQKRLLIPEFPVSVEKLKYLITNLDIMIDVV